MEICRNFDAWIDKTIYFLSLTLKKSKLVFLIPKPIVERFLTSYILLFVKNYHMGLNNQRTPYEMGESKLDTKWWGMCRVLRPVCDFLTSKSVLQKKTVWKSIKGK